jgi:hypothetical protein
VDACNEYRRERAEAYLGRGARRKMPSMLESSSANSVASSGCLNGVSQLRRHPMATKMI